MANHKNIKNKKNLLCDTWHIKNFMVYLKNNYKVT